MNILDTESYTHWFAGGAITLPMLLDRREARAMRQRALLAAYAAPVICLCVNMPGPVKQNRAAQHCAAAGERALRAALQAAGTPLLYAEHVDAPTGPELLCCARAPAEALKALCVGLEQSHPLGRLFDLDVLGMDGTPLPRTALGHPPRRCLVCGAPAAQCTGRAPHPLLEVQAAMLQLLKEDAHGYTGPIPAL